jgi:hypothetical protein
MSSRGDAANLRSRKPKISWEVGGGAGIVAAAITCTGASENPPQAFASPQIRDTKTLAHLKEINP